MSVTLDGLLAFNVAFLAFNSGMAVGFLLRKVGEVKRKKRTTTARPTVKKSR